MDNELTSAVAEFQEKMAQVARIQADCAQLVATGWAQRRRVRVTVNADGIAVDIKFGAGVSELTYDEIAAAVTEASQQAVLEIAEKSKELTAPLAVAGGAAPDVPDVLRMIGSLREQLR